MKYSSWKIFTGIQNDVTAVSENPNHQALWGMDSKLHQKSKLRLLKLLFLIKELVPAKEEESQRDLYKLYSFKNGTKEEIHSLHLK